MQRSAGVKLVNVLAAGVLGTATTGALSGAGVTQPLTRRAAQAAAASTFFIFVIGSSWVVSIISLEAGQAVGGGDQRSPRRSARNSALGGSPAQKRARMASIAPGASGTWAGLKAFGSGV